MNKLDIERLIKKSVAVRECAYAPYSKFKVGAALLTKNGNIYVGSNFECVSFGAGVCAERVAIGNAIANGEKDFVAICICGDTIATTPCGICRQALLEFGNPKVICCDKNGMNHIVFLLNDLLPNAFHSI